MCIVGVGLIGGSLARALRKANYVGEIVGADCSRKALEKAKQLGVIDRYDTNITEAVKGADMVFVAVPLGVMGAVFGKIKAGISPGCVVTDAGSVKGSVVKAWSEV